MNAQDVSYRIEVRHSQYQYRQPQLSPLSVNQVKLPKLSIPVFKGDPMEWGMFWEDFQATVYNNPHIDERQKLAYLREAIQDQEVAPMISWSTTTPRQYNELISFLKETYNQKN